MQSSTMLQNRIGGVYQIHPASSNDHDINRTGLQGMFSLLPEPMREGPQSDLFDARKTFILMIS